jgi:hypothetical protein
MNIVMSAAVAGKRVGGRVFSRLSLTLFEIFDDVDGNDLRKSPGMVYMTEECIRAENELSVAESVSHRNGEDALTGR